MLKRIIRTILCKLVEFSLYRVKSFKKKDGKIKKLLIVRIDNIGDFVIFSPMLKYYRMLYPNYHITLLVNRLALELAKRFDEMNALIAFDRRKFNRDLIYKRRLLKKIKEEEFDVVIYPTYSRESNGDYIVRFSEAAEKIGFDGDVCNITLKEKLENDKNYTKIIPAIPGIILETERNKEFVEAFGAKVDNAIPSFTPSVDDETETKKLLFDNGLTDDKLFIVICPGVSSNNRMWPLEKYAQVVAWLRKEKNLEIVISGSNNERYLAEKIAVIANVSIIDITGKTTLTALAAILKKSILCIGNDTGIIHLAAAVGTPTICIMGGGHFGRFFPYGNLSRNKIIFKKMDCFGCSWRCIYPNKINMPVPCISHIHVADALREAEIVLNEIKKIRR
ncbi:MAG: glycosyltransferase family 9 protein [Candidatus Omnitrophica bacterium]|jgi:ADP-heptose:LPS heptosyltransferase|nr:glycosyltransferase family 9 protein [Candidatus Omnitrophota bacterium]